MRQSGPNFWRKNIPGFDEHQHGFPVGNPTIQALETVRKMYGDYEFIAVDVEIALNLRRHTLIIQKLYRRGIEFWARLWYGVLHLDFTPNAMSVGFTNGLALAVTEEKIEASITKSETGIEKK